MVWFKHKRLIENIPTSKIRSLAMGLVEIYGQVFPVGDKLLISPHTQKSCVYYRYLVERYETHYDSRTKRTEGRWVTVKNISERISFYVKDETGTVLVDPKGAHIEISTDFQTRMGNMRYHEWVIEPNDSLYIMGSAGENPLAEKGAITSIENILIQKGKYEKFYFISDKSEKDILKMLNIKVYVCLALGVVFIVIGLIVLLGLV
ncbi:MAG: GIDE domain-containing protein [Methanobacteriota archaeon]